MSRQFYRQIYEEETRYLGAYFACLVFLKQTKPQTNQKSNNKKSPKLPQIFNNEYSTTSQVT